MKMFGKNKKTEEIKEWKTAPEPIVEEAPVEPKAEPIEEPKVVEKPKKEVKPEITNHTIDTFTILVKYHEEMVQAVAKYDGIIAELIKLTQPVAKDEEKEAESA